MEATIKGNQLIITIDLQKAALSKSGKTLTVASSNGFKQTDAKVDGKPVSISVNAFIK